jgi:UDP-glucose 4-epimerase
MSNVVLLTGGLGYIGGRLASSLVARGYEVRCGTRRCGMASPDWLPTMSMVTLDWMSIDRLTGACQGVDHVIHLAAMNEIDSVNDPVGALQMNGLASLRLLEAAKVAGVRRFVYFSTAHVYGAPLKGVIDETTLTRPTHPYAITHKTAEDFILAAHEKKQIEGVVIRLSNGFGAPVTPDVDRWTLLINDLCRQAATTGKLRLNSAGTQLRDFVALTDVARAVNHLLQLGVDKLGDGLFNLGGGQSRSILEMTERVAARWRVLTGYDIEVIRPAADGLPVSVLDYRCDKLAATGFLLAGQIDREIDDTLALCLRAFRK